MQRQNLDRPSPMLLGLVCKILNVFFLSFLTVSTAHAFEFQMHGFADLIATRSSVALPINNNGNDDKDLTVDPESRLGLNLSADLDNNLTFNSQIIGRGTNSGTYVLGADWLFVTYRPSESIAIRVGRQLSPVYLFSEQIDVGFTYLWARLPYEVYGIYPVKSFNGAALVHTLSINNNWKLRTEVFGGAGDLAITTSSSSFTGSNDDHLGAEVSLVSDHFKARAGYTTAHPHGSIALTQPAITIGADLGSAKVMSAGLIFDYADLVVATEFARLMTTGTLVHRSSGIYASVGYNISARITPYLTYASMFAINGTAFIYPNSSISTTPKTTQQSTMAGLRIKLSPSAVFKAEYMRTQENFLDLNRNFGANVLTASIDLVF